jgi:hypothetical protein
MEENKITIIIDKPVSEVFEFTTNPKNTHLWIPSIEEEISDKYPPELNTIYKNRGKASGWMVYKVVEFEKDRLFTLCDSDNNYFVRYTYRKLDGNKTELEYFEWVKKGELKSPFSYATLLNLKAILQGKR